MNVLFFLRPKVSTAYIYYDNTLRQGLEKLRHYGYTAIPVIDRDGKYRGTVTEGDFLWKLTDESAWDNHAQERLYVKDILKADRNRAVNVNASLEDLFLMAQNQNFVPVTDDLGSFIGIVTSAIYCNITINLLIPKSRRSRNRPRRQTRKGHKPWEIFTKDAYSARRARHTAL